MFGKAERLFLEYKGPFWLALTQLEHGEWAAAEGREEQAARLASRALAGFGELSATPSIDRARALIESVAPEQVEV